ncbi:hypothetical protein HK096_000891, partial [Nowakowskiella sp. JEL0078]
MNAPSHTLYVRGLNDKVKKPGICLFSARQYPLMVLSELKKSLYMLFSQCGQIVDLVAKKTLRERGQAHIVFSDISSATAAIRLFQGFPFYDRPLQIEYSVSKSNMIALLDGTFKLDSKAPKPNVGKRPRTEDDSRPTKKAALDSGDDDSGSDMEASDDDEPSQQENKPNPILFIQNIPASVTPDILKSLFSQYPGFKEIRSVPGNASIAFAEYSSELQSEVAKGMLN